MPNFQVLEPAIDPNNRITFLLDWELTMKCNLDCSYCTSDLYGGHDNSTQHPDKTACLQALDFMFEYVDQYMQYKPKGIRYVVLNVYGGESLHHPDIVEILSTVRTKYTPYADRWHLTVTTTTNAIVPHKKLLKILPYIDEFTVSSHVESTAKQKQQFKENLITIRNARKRLKCIVIMHNDPVLFQEATEFLDWLKDHQIAALPKQIDNRSDNLRSYNEKSIKWFDSFYQRKSYKAINQFNKEDYKDQDLSKIGRACCGGRQTCLDQDYKTREYYVLDNRFTDWYCSVDQFFLFVKQLTGEVFVNKDCKMTFDGTVGPIGTLDHTDKIIDQLQQRLAAGQSVIQCKKSTCLCGLCAPKAQDLDTYKSIMKKYQKVPQS